MPFKFKDLLVNVLPGGEAPGRANAGCPTISVDPARQANTCPTISVDPAQAVCEGGSFCPTISVMQAQAVCQGSYCPTISVQPMALTCPTISVIPQAAVCGGSFCPTISVMNAMYCPTASATMGGGLPQTAIGGCPTLTVPTIGMAGGGAASLAALKQQLQQALAQVEEQEKALQPGLPQTLEETEDLERRMVEAVEELREHKKTLQGGQEKPAARPAKKARR